MIAAVHEHIRDGREAVAPDPALGHAASLPSMLTGTLPSRESACPMDVDMVLHAEHGANASSFAARVVASTDADLHGAITAAVATAAGPAHGSAAENVVRMAQAIGEPERAAERVRRKRAAKEPVMGVGHRGYRTEDPPARHMPAGVERLSRALGEPEWNRILAAVVAAMQTYARRSVAANVDHSAHAQGSRREVTRAGAHRPKLLLAGERASTARRDARKSSELARIRNRMPATMRRRGPVRRFECRISLPAGGGS